MNFIHKISAKVSSPKPSISAAMVGGLLLFSLSLCHADVTGRYVRVENPTAGLMAWRQIEIYSNGQNIVAKHPEMFSGTVYPDHNIKTGDGAEMTDGVTDTSARGVYFPASLKETDLNPWFEVDLGRAFPLGKIVLYGASYPERQYLDKGNRVITILDNDRHVVWTSKWNYYDKNKYPGGVFTFAPSIEETNSNPLIGRTVSEGTGSWIAMGWLLDAEQVQPPPDAEKRMEHFAARNSPAEIEKLARDFFSELDDTVPELAGARQLYAEGKYQEALDSWKEYWFAKMKRLNRHAGVHTEYSSYATQGDDLVNGLMVTISAREARAVRYIPGQIPWINLPNPSDESAMDAALSDCEQKAQVGKVTRPLLEAYSRNPDPKYIKTWADVMDDWSLNFFNDAEKTPYEVENLFTFDPCNQWGDMMEDMSDAAVTHPELVKLMPASTLARVQLLALQKYSSAWWYQNRYTTFIHISSGLCAWDIVLPYIMEFRSGQRAMVEWRQSMERYMTMATEPDGSPTDIGDEGHMEFAPQLGFPVGRLEATDPKPDWYTPGWRNRFMAWDDNSFKYFLRHPSPGGYDHRTGVAYRPERWTSTTQHYTTSHIYPFKPPFISRDKEIYSIPEVRRILDALGHVSTGRPFTTDPALAPVIAKEQQSHDDIVALLGADKPGPPHINSDWMPYTGSYYFRSGWNDNDAFLSMLAAGSRGGSSSLFGGDRRPQYTSFWNYDYNFPLFSGDPIYVDGLPPQQLYGHFDTCKPGTKIDVLTGAEQKPAPFRWLSSDLYSYGEAIFNGAYQQPPDFQGPWDYRLKMNPPGPAVTGVKNSRQILQLRNSRLFIITDTIAGSDLSTHTFSVGYNLALSSKSEGAPKPLAPDQLQIDEQNEILRANNPDGPSVSIYQFSDQPIHYQKGPDASLDYQAYAPRLGSSIGIANQQITASCTDSSELKLVTLVCSRDRKINERIASTQPFNDNGIVGFHATLVDGSQIWYLSAPAGGAKLDCGPASAQGEALLAVVDNKGLSGILLGGSSLSLGGQGVTLKNPDVQFSVSGGEVKTLGIYTPIDPVSFEPNRNTFADSETVQMSSNTPNVEIHYTTDGSQPTAASPLYKGPIKITESTEFAARAYRVDSPGKPMDADDFEINGTKFTEATYGWFYKKALHPALDLSEKDLQQGLNYDYLQAPWWKLFASEHWLPAEGGGVVNREMDLSKMPIGTPYGVRFRGYIKIPGDGAYTFEAPQEFTSMENVPGYDLRVYVDGEEWYLTQWWHGQGTWTIPLKQGFHEFQVDFADARTNPWRKTGMWNYYPRPWVIHKGNPSDILISGPGIEHSRIPAEWLYRKGEPRLYADEKILVDSRTELNCDWNKRIDASLAGVTDLYFKTTGEAKDVFAGLAFVGADGTKVTFGDVSSGAVRNTDKNVLIVHLTKQFDHLTGVLKLPDGQNAVIGSSS